MLEKQRELSVSLKTLCDKVLLKVDKFLNSAMDKKSFATQHEPQRSFTLLPK